MKNIIISLLIFSASIYNSKAQEWKSYTSEAGKYSIEFLGDLNETTNGTDTLVIYKTTIENAPMVYIISVTKHAVNLENNIDTLLTSSVKSFSESVKGSVNETKKVSLNGVEGTYALLYLQESTFRLDYYVYMKGVYQYQIIAYSATLTFDQQETNHLIGSFRIIEDE